MSFPEKIGLPGDIDGEACLLTELNSRFRMPLIAYFLRRAVTYADAEDMAQEVLIRASDRAGEVEQVDAYLFGIAANLFTDRCRRMAVRLRHVQDVTATATETDHLDPERVLIGRERLAIVTKAIGELSDGARQVFILSRFERLPQKDIARKLGVSLSTVEKRLANAIAHIVRRLGDRP